MEVDGQTWDRAVDFVVGGAGIGGATAAITADEIGLDVLILEKSAKVGGVSTMSGGLLWVGNNHLEAEAGIEDSAAAVEEYIRYGAIDPIDDAARDLRGAVAGGTGIPWGGGRRPMDARRGLAGLPLHGGTWRGRERPDHRDAPHPA